MVSNQPYILLLVGWVVYFILHSGLASMKVKNLIYRSGLTPQAYRLIYNVLSIVLLFGLFLLNGMIAGDYLIPKSTVSKYTGLFLAGGGVFVLRASFKEYSMRRFLGLAQQNNEIMKRSGILSRIRHPIYTATLLISLGYLLFDPRWPTLLSMFCIWCYLPVGIYLEEKKLIREFGEKYKKYKNEVPAIIPRIHLK